jgi:hypothetical protein
MAVVSLAWNKLFIVSYLIRIYQADASPMSNEVHPRGRLRTRASARSEVRILFYFTLQEYAVKIFWGLYV